MTANADKKVSTTRKQRSQTKKEAKIRKNSLFAKAFQRLNNQRHQKVAPHPGRGVAPPDDTLNPGAEDDDPPCDQGVVDLTLPDSADVADASDEDIILDQFMNNNFATPDMDMVDYDPAGAHHGIQQQDSEQQQQQLPLVHPLYLAEQLENFQAALRVMNGAG